jgi:hypothetical protein
MGFGLAAALALLAVAPAVGQEAAADTAARHITSPYHWVGSAIRMGAFGGWLGTNRGASDLGPGSAPFGGVGFRARISNPLTIEVRAAYGKTNLWVIDPRLPNGPAPVDTTTTRWASIEAGLQLAITGQRSWHRLQPYLLLEAGFLRGFDQVASDSLASADEAAFRYSLGTMPVLELGAGFEWIPGGRYSVSFEARDKLLHLKAPAGFFRSDVLSQIDQLGLPAPQDRQWTHNLALTITVWRYF